MKKHYICPCGCGATASPELIASIERIEEKTGLHPRKTSIVRCRSYNKEIGGSIWSPHILSADPDEFGSIDWAIKPVARSKGGNAKKVYKIIKAAEEEGFNNFEICNGHIHTGKVPPNHPMANTYYWGISK